MKKLKYDYEGVLKKYKEGMTMKAACSDLGVNLGSFNSWYYGQGRSGQKIRSMKKTPTRTYVKKPTVTTIQLPVTDNVAGRIFAFYGSPNDIASAIRSL